MSTSGLIRSEAFRCKTITNGLLDFSRTRATEHVLVNLADVISSAARLLSHQQRGENVKFQIETAEDLPPVSGDAGQLQQAVIALATNAIDAMPDGGVLRISEPAKGQAGAGRSERYRRRHSARRILRESSSRSSPPRKLAKAQVLAWQFVMVS